MNKHSLFMFFPAVACLTAAFAVLAVFLVSCGGEPEEPDSAPESSVSVEKNVVSVTKTSSSSVSSVTETAPSANTKPMDKFVYPSEGLICVERVYYDASPTPETEKVVYLRAPASSVNLIIPDGVTEISYDAFFSTPCKESVRRQMESRRAAAQAAGR